MEYTIPITFTTNQQQNYDDVYPTMMMENTVQITLPNTLDENDYVIFNIQGQGYIFIFFNLFILAIILVNTILSIYFNKFIIQGLN